MNRRSFITKLLGVAVTARVLPSITSKKKFEYNQVNIHDALEKNPQMWYGGSAGGGKSEQLNELNRVTLEQIMPRVKTLFEKDDTFYSSMNKRSI